MLREGSCALVREDRLGPRDDALTISSLKALGWAELARDGGRVGFIKIDVQGLEGQVLRGAADTLRTHALFVYYEDSMLPPADQKGALIQRITQPESAGRRLYDCKCANDCFCSPRRGLAKGRHQ